MRIIEHAGPVWRLMARTQADRPTAPVGAPEGRFHHAGQIAIYASLTTEGTLVAIRRYLTDGVDRVLVPLRLDAGQVADVRGDPAASVVWQDERARGAAASTWVLSDVARRANAQGLLYSSRTRPDLSHVVVFDTACLSLAGPIMPMPEIEP